MEPSSTMLGTVGSGLVLAAFLLAAMWFGGGFR